MSPTFTFALAGNPNCGKTTMFNALTGARQHVGNWAGLHLEKQRMPVWPGALRWELSWERQLARQLTADMVQASARLPASSWARQPALRKRAIPARRRSAAMIMPTCSACMPRVIVSRFPATS